MVGHQLLELTILVRVQVPQFVAKRRIAGLNPSVASAKEGPVASCKLKIVLFCSTIFNHECD